MSKGTNRKGTLAEGMARAAAKREHEMSPVDKNLYQWIREAQSWLESAASSVEHGKPYQSDLNEASALIECASATTEWQNQLTRGN